MTAIFAEADLPEKGQAYVEINKNYVDGGLGTALSTHEHSARNHL